MNKWKYTNEENTSVKRYSPTAYTSTDNDEFQQYINEGGQVDPFRTHDEWVTDTLRRLQAEHDRIITSEKLENNQSKKDKKLIGALNRKQDGNETSKDIQMLGDNDILDIWFDDMETAKETGETWIEDPARTEQELIDYDPSTAVVWPDYPL